MTHLAAIVSKENVSSTNMCVSQSSSRSLGGYRSSTIGRELRRIDGMVVSWIKSLNYRHMTNFEILNEEALAAMIRRETLAAIQEYFEARQGHDSSPPKPRYLSRREVAEYLSIGLSTVDYWARIGRLKKIKVGRSVRFDRQELDESLQKLQKYARS